MNDSAKDIGCKKILIAIGSLSNGGAERVVSVWASQLADCGYDVSLLLFTRQKDEYPISDKVKLYSVAETAEDFVALSPICKYKKIRSIIKGIGPEYIIPFLTSIQRWIMFTSIGLSCKRIETIRVNPWIFPKYRNLKRILIQVCYNTAHKIIIQASDQKPWFSKRNQKKCVLIPNPISQVYKQCYRDEISQDVVNFVAAGRVDSQKNYPMMIDAFASVVKQYPDVKLKIFGKGTDAYTKSLQDRINALGMQDHILLMGRSSQINEEYKKNDAFLMSSDYEGLPNALMEAMASRLICISTDCKTGPRDLIEENVNGYMVPVGDGKALADAIVKVINMPYEERVAMADAARHKIMTYCSEENSLNQLCSILK
jgi:glycosyltransferase involved in cell wall biosynthesis